MAAAALLAVPVAVAGVIGFSGGLGGVAGGFSDALAGPAPEPAGAVDPGPGLDHALVDLVGSTDEGGGGDGREPGTGDRGVNGPATPGADGGNGSGANGPIPSPPDVRVPIANNPSGSVDSLVEDVNRTVDGLVGGR